MTQTFLLPSRLLASLTMKRLQTGDSTPPHEAHTVNGYGSQAAPASELVTVIRSLPGLPPVWRPPSLPRTHRERCTAVTGQSWAGSTACALTTAPSLVLREGVSDAQRGGPSILATSRAKHH